MVPEPTFIDVQDALRRAGRGLHPNAAVTLARRLFDPGTADDESTRKAMDQLRFCRELDAKYATTACSTKDGPA